MEELEKELFIKNSDIECMQNEFKEYKETSKLIEEEFECHIKELTKKLNHYINENEKIKIEKEKIKNDLTNHNKFLDKKNENLEKENNNFIKKQQYLQEKVIDLENENEELRIQNRNTQNSIFELEEKMNKLLEQLALVETELEDNKYQAHSQIENLKLQLKETETNVHLINVRNQPIKTKIQKTINNISSLDKIVFSKNNEKKIKSFWTKTEIKDEKKEKKCISVHKSNNFKLIKSKKNIGLTEKTDNSINISLNEKEKKINQLKALYDKPKSGGIIKNIVQNLEIKQRNLKNKINSKSNIKM